MVIKNLALFALRSRGKAAGEEPHMIEEITAEAALAIEETREISYNLRPFQLDRLGLSKAIEAHRQYIEVQTQADRWAIAPTGDGWYEEGVTIDGATLKIVVRKV